MDKREQLIKLILEAEIFASEVGFFNCHFSKPKAECVTDFLLENGVILPPCKVGDTVWVFNQLKGCIYENKVHGIYLTGTGDCKNTVRLEYTNQFGEKSYRKYSFSQFGKNVFLSPEEAERRKFEYLKTLQ